MSTAPVVPRLHRTVIGESGPPVVFLHGLFGQGKNWTTIARQLSSRHRVLLLDLPDHGRSDWTEDVSYPAMATAVASALREVVPDGRWAVVGHSMGGKVAMALALRHRELVERLAVVDIAPVDYQRISAFGDYVRAMRSVPLDRLRQRSEADEVMRPLVPDPVVRGFLLQNLRREATGDGARWSWQMNLGMLGDRLAELWRWPADLRDAEPYPGPVLWIAGAESDYVTAEHAPAMRALFPAVRTITIKHAGHWVHSEQPEVFLQVISRFLSS